MRWFSIWHPFVIHMCRNRVIGVIKYPKEKLHFFYPKMVRRGRKASHCILKTIRSVLVFKSRLYLAQMRSYRRSRIFCHFWVLDLTSEVTGWPRTINFGVNGFVSGQATHWFLNRSSNSLRSQTRRGSYPPPPCAVKVGEMAYGVMGAQGCQ